MKHEEAILSLVGFGSVLVFLTAPARAHCPLCSAGAGGGAALASALGVGLAVVGVFVGAFGLATGAWMAKYVTREVIPNQENLVAVGVFLTVVLPVLPLMNETVPVYLSLAGEYGTLTNRIYFVNTYLVGAVAGAFVAYTTPQISSWVSDVRGTTLPYQGLVLTFSLLGLSATVLEVVL